MNRSKKTYAGFDKLSRKNKANQIITILKTFTDISKCHILDIGTGSGYIAYEISKNCKSLVSVDVTDERLEKKGYEFIKISDEHLPLEENIFDIVISNQVIEHVQNQNLHISEIYRVLKKEGLLYLSTPNKYWIIDPHYYVPFISWFYPSKFGGFVLKILKNKSWDTYPLSYKQILKLTKNKFEINNISLIAIKHPEKYKLDMFKKIQPITKLFPIKLLELLNPIIPGYIVVLRKK